MENINSMLRFLDRCQYRKDNKICPFCGCDTSNMKFKDALSEKEYKISGLCQKCQDKMFG